MTKFIYAIKNPTDALYFYVGASINVSERAKFHMNRYNNSCCTEKLFELADNGIRPVFEILDKTEGEWRDLETSWMIKLIEAGHPILNKQIKGYRKKDYFFELVDNTLKEDK